MRGLSTQESSGSATPQKYIKGQWVKTDRLGRGGVNFFFRIFSVSGHPGYRLGGWGWGGILFFIFFFFKYCTITGLIIRSHHHRHLHGGYRAISSSNHNHNQNHKQKKIEIYFWKFSKCHSWAATKPCWAYVCVLGCNWSWKKFIFMMSCIDHVNWYCPVDCVYTAVV